MFQSSEDLAFLIVKGESNHMALKIPPTCDVLRFAFRFLLLPVSLEPHKDGSLISKLTPSLSPLGKRDPTKSFLGDLSCSEWHLLGLCNVVVMTALLLRLLYAWCVCLCVCVEQGQRRGIRGLNCAVCQTGEQRASFEWPRLHGSEGKMVELQC